MTFDKATLRMEVRSLTDYPVELVGDDDLDSLITVAQNEIDGIVGVEHDFSKRTPNRALMWTTCLFALLKAREVDGAAYSLEALEYEPVEAAGKDHNDNATMWFNKSEYYVTELMEAQSAEENDRANKYGKVTVQRPDRQYER